MSEDLVCTGEFSDETHETVKLIESFAELIEDGGCSKGAELRNILIELFYGGRRIGFTDCRDSIREIFERFN